MIDAEVNGGEGDVAKVACLDALVQPAQPELPPQSHHRTRRKPEAAEVCGRVCVRLMRLRVLCQPNNAKRRAEGV